MSTMMSTPKSAAAASRLLLSMACGASLVAMPRDYCADGFAVREPPMPLKWPIVGTLPDFFARGGVDRLREIYEDMYSEYGSVFGMSIMGDDELVVCDPYVFDAVIRKEGRFPIGGSESVTTFKEYYEETNNTMGLKALSRGPEWKEWRRPLEADIYAEWESYMPAIAVAASEISKVAGREVTEEKNIPFVDFISRSAFDMFTAVMYGEHPRTTDSRAADPRDIEFVRASQAAFDLTGEVLSNPLEKAFGSDIYKSFKVNMDMTFDFAYNKSEKFLAQLEQQKQFSEEGKEGASKCPVSALKNNIPFVERIANRGILPTDDILSVGAPLLMAGVDTTAYVMSWLYLNFATNPDVQAKLANELKTVLKGADLISLKQLNSLPYLKACIRESNRLTPPTPILQKKLEEDIDVVVDDMAYRVLAGQRISLNLRAIPMDPKYVEDPTTYRPERFLLDAIAARKGTPSEIIDHPSFADPFGRGKRRCLGSNVAMAEIAILAARMVQDWEITLVDPNDAAKWRPKQKLMLKADPYPAMNLVPRV